MLSSNKGNAIIMVALTLVVLIGFAALAVDIGYMYSERAKMVTIADASALAGAKELKDTGSAAQKAEEKAEAIAKANAEAYGFSPEKILIRKTMPANIPLGHIAVVAEATTKEIRVTVRENVGLFFARVLKINDSKIGAFAKAKLLPSSQLGNLLPLAVSKEDFDLYKYYKIFNMKVDQLASHSGNFHAVSYDGIKGGNVFRDRLAGGYEGDIDIGDVMDPDMVLDLNLDSEPGQMKGPTVQGLNDRLKNCYCPRNDTHNPTENVYYYSCPNGCAETPCPRVVFIPVIETWEVNGRSTLKVVGFASAVLTEVVGEKQDAIIKGYFIETTAGSSPTPKTDYGVKTPKLVE